MAGPGAPEAMRFEVLKAVLGEGAAGRLGRLTLPKRDPVDTPNFFAVTSRGVVPHLTPDNVAAHGRFGGSYLALEDFIEKAQKQPNRTPPVYLQPVSGDDRRLHAYTALPPSHITVLGPRRNPAVRSTLGNGRDFITVFTSTGFQPLTNREYVAAAGALRPDIAVPLCDISHGAAAGPSSRRGLRQAQRTEDWVVEWCAALGAAGAPPPGVATFAPTLPVPYPVQREYLARLAGDDVLPHLAGLALYDVDVAPDLSSHPALLPLPRLSLHPPSGPHQILRQVALGVDVLLVPFVNAVSDAGVALTFTFPPPEDAGAGAGAAGTGPLPLGVDLSDPAHRTSLAPLAPGCACHACAAHHRAYLHHLLGAREMLSWALLQLHNHAALAAFFAGVRASLAGGRDRFGADCRAFAAAYEEALPPGMGARPRARGYHFKSEGGDARINGPAWGRLGGEGGEGRPPAAAAGGPGPGAGLGTGPPERPGGDARGGGA